MLAGALFRILSLIWQNSTDDIDRLNHLGSAVVFATFGACLAMMQYFGKPIECWVPKHFEKAWEKYVENLCFADNTYYLHWNQDIPSDLEERRNARLIYYQWVPYVLGIQAVLFFVSPLIWSAFAYRGLNISETKSELMRDKVVMEICATFHRAPTQANNEKKSLSKIKEKFSGSYTTILFMVTKSVNFANIFIQLIFLRYFLHQKTLFWGYEILHEFIVYGYSWLQTGVFPRVTLCDLEIKTLGNNLQNWTFQCVLKLNAFYEKIFIFVWFWLCLLAILSLLNLIYWSFALSMPHSRLHFISKYLPNKNIPTHQLRHFVLKTLRFDGVLLLRLLNRREGDLATFDVVCELWKLKQD